MDDEIMDDDDEMEDIEEVNEDEDDEEMAEESEEKKVYLPGDPIAEGEELVFDESAYTMYHQAQTGSVHLYDDLFLTFLINISKDWENEGKFYGNCPNKLPGH